MTTLGKNILSASNGERTQVRCRNSFLTPDSNRPVAHEVSMEKMGILTDRVVNVGGFAEPHREFLAFQRTNVFLKREINA
jgi:hypothetical protein